MKELLTLMFAGFVVLTAAAKVVVYENDFEGYQLGEVRRPVQDAEPFMEHNVTNWLYCEVEGTCGVDNSKGVHCYLLKNDGQRATGGAQFDTGLAPRVFSTRLIAIYEAAWKGSNLASIDLTDGTNLFFRLYSNGTTARRIGVTNLNAAAFVELAGEDGDPSKVAFSPRYGVFRIHVLFPEGQIFLIERDFEGMSYQYPQSGLYGMPGIFPTHLGGGVNARSYAPNYDRNCYIDDLKVATVPEPGCLAVLAAAGLFFAVGRKR